MQLDYGREEITDLNNQNGTGQYWTAMDYVLGLGLWGLSFQIDFHLAL